MVEWYLASIKIEPHIIDSLLASLFGMSKF